MKKDDIVKKIKELSDELLALCSDKEKGVSILKDILHHKEVECNGYKLVDIPVLGDEEEINVNGCYQIVRNRIATIFKTNGYDYVMRKDGYDVVMKNYTKSAHVPFDMLFDLHKKRNGEGLSKEEEELYGILLVSVVNMCQVMNIASTSEHRQAMLKILVDEWFKEMSEALDKPLEDLDGDDLKENNLLDMGTDA